MVNFPLTLTGIVDGQVGDAVDWVTPFNETRTYLENLANGVQAFDRQSFGTAEALTIVSDTITPTKTHVVVDTQAAASTDDLSTVNGGSAGRILFLRSANNSRTVVLKHGIGNIRTATGNDYALNNIDLFAYLIHNGTYWIGAIMPTNTFLNLGTDTTLTIASGVITRTRTRHLIDTEGAASTDDLDTINGGVEGDVLFLQQVSGRMVRVRHSIGNIVLANRRNRYLVGGQAAGLLLVYDGSLWVEHAPADSIPYPGERRVIQAQASGAAPFIEVLGAAASTATGTASANNSIDSVYTNFVQAAATINTFAGFASAVFNLVRRQHNPRFVCLLRTGPNAADIQNIRFWVGLSSATVAVTTDTLATSFIGFRWGTSTPDAGWVGVVSDGTNQSLTSALTGTVAVDTVYKLAFRVDDTAGAVHFSVNDGPELTLMTNLPASATELGYHCRQITLAAATKNFKVSRLYVEAN